VRTGISIIERFGDPTLEHVHMSPEICLFLIISFEIDSVARSDYGHR